MTKPIRVQLSRKAGWRMPANTVSVARPGRWGNPFRVGDFGISDAAEAVRRFRASVLGFTSNGSFCPPSTAPESHIGQIIANAHQLRGKNLACWCRPGTPCHADVLIELANADA